MTSNGNMYSLNSTLPMACGLPKPAGEPLAVSSVAAAAGVTNT